MKRVIYLACVSLALFVFTCQPSTTSSIQNYDVVVLGKGTGAVAAAIQSARSGAKTLLVNPLPWLGGMLTSAGVSATDGNHQLPAGLWGEFRQHLRDHYGGADSLFTGWVSNTMFEPKVGAKYWAEIAAATSLLTLHNNSTYTDLKYENEAWQLVVKPENRESYTVSAKELVDGTDLGDVAASQGVAYDLGMEASALSGESMAPKVANDIIQDFTYAAILKDFGPEADKTIPEPPNYDPSVFDCACRHNCDLETAHPCETMISYGKLPNGKYMINWPIEGNDYYSNMVEMSDTERAVVYQKAKEKTLAFIYYIQHELGFKHLGLDPDEFPTQDLLPLMPYHREGRRIKGLVRLNVNHILQPFDYSLYRTGIAVGDYPIDHHHYEYPTAPEIDFPPVPSFNIPLGALIPAELDHLVIADKPISVSNIVNGSSRLQPVVLQIGQAAGLLAAMAAKQGVSPRALKVREVQGELLAAGGYLLPYMDVLPDDPAFKAIHRVGATGMLKGKGIPYKWANQTRFYPDTTMNTLAFVTDIQAFDPAINTSGIDPEEVLTTGKFIALLQDLLGAEEKLATEAIESAIAEITGTDYQADAPIIKRHVALLLDKYVDPFHQQAVAFDGTYIK